LSSWLHGVSWAVHRKLGTRVCCEAVQSAILATAWLLVYIARAFAETVPLLRALIQAQSCTSGAAQFDRVSSCTNCFLQTVFRLAHTAGVCRLLLIRTWHIDDWMGEMWCLEGWGGVIYEHSSWCRSILSSWRNTVARGREIWKVGFLLKL